MKRVVMPVRWQCAKCRRWYCGNQPCPWCWRHSRSSFCWHPPVSQQFVILTDSSFLSYRQSQLFVSKRAFVDASSPA
ncbi:hypothetical protein [Escherichia coli]|uniref:hypothetical protein n=1 Tax=Escherichia coli TaxID=562 RepID=UPI001E4CBF77|nr:hypothetical protein [Escherichia coli]MCD9245022.1 hypothetical protein [Escherichia coli]WEB77616.1 hypothetical protein LVJ26_20850 [Escherichia coli]WEE82159.1 hypothetical protein LZE53_20840 [Escherichia coli]